MKADSREVDVIPDDPGYTTLRTDPDAIDRGVEALCRFVFPEIFVPRHEMAEAVITAVNAIGDWRTDLPKKRVCKLSE